MKINKLTTILLAVISVNLTINTLKNSRIGTPSYANEIDLDLPSTTYGLVPLNADGSITVKLADYDRMDVRIVDISTSDQLNVSLDDINTSDELNINIDEIGGWSVYSSIPVEIKE